jgi:small subunit ribosomal protein S6
MNSYESTIAFHAESGESAVGEVLERAKQVIAGQGGEIIQVVDWGARELAYPIRKQRRGAFRIIEFRGGGAAVAELERNLRISDHVLRYITVRVDPNRPPLEAPKPRREFDAEGVDELEGEGLGEGGPDLGAAGDGDAGVDTEE